MLQQTAGTSGGRTARGGGSGSSSYEASCLPQEKDAKHGRGALVLPLHRHGYSGRRAEQCWSFDRESSAGKGAAAVPKAFVFDYS